VGEEALGLGTPHVDLVVGGSLHLLLRLLAVVVDRSGDCGWGRSRWVIWRLLRRSVDESKSAKK
jgi:hypothetical protein